MSGCCFVLCGESFEFAEGGEPYCTPTLVGLLLLPLSPTHPHVSSYLQLFLCHHDPIFTTHNSREKRDRHWCGLMCSHCSCIEAPAGIQMPLEGTAALLNGAGSCPTASFLKCTAITSQNADTRDIVLRARHRVRSLFNAPKPSICHASIKASVRRNSAHVSVRFTIAMKSARHFSFPLHLSITGCPKDNYHSSSVHVHPKRGIGEEGGAS